MVENKDATIEIQKAIEYVNSVIAKGEPFTDAEFPPCKESIFSGNDKQCDIPGVHTCTLDKDCGDYIWKRTSEIFEDP